MGQYFVLVNQKRQEMVCPFCAGGTSKLFEWCAQPHSGLLPYLLRRSNETGGGDIPDAENAEYAGRWAGEEVYLVGDYDQSGLYKAAYETYRNITPDLCREYNEFMGCAELALQTEYCSCCKERGAAKQAVDEFIDVLGRAALEAVLQLSAEQVAGPSHQGKPGGAVRRHGSQAGTVCLSTQKVRVRKPRLRTKTGGARAEVPVPAYEAMQAEGPLRDKLGEILLSGVSTRQYERVVPEMATSCGISKSSVSRQFKAASAAKLQALCERRFEELDLLVIYIDGVRFGPHHVIGAIGVDAEGRKHVLGLREGATENAVVVKDLLSDLVARGVDPARRRLFVVDGSKALRAGIDAVLGPQHPVQRCRNHKVENVMGYLPEPLKEQMKTVMKADTRRLWAAYRLSADEGIKRLKTQARWLQPEHPDAARSLLEDLEETFTINRLGLSPKLRRCLATTNLIESPHSGIRLRTRRVTNWQGGGMVLRWAAGAFLATEANFRRIDGYRELWMLKAALDEETSEGKEVTAA